METDAETDKVKPVYPPSTSLSVGYNYQLAQLLLNNSIHRFGQWSSLMGLMAKYVWGVNSKFVRITVKYYSSECMSKQCTFSLWNGINIIIHSYYRILVSEGDRLTISVQSKLSQHCGCWFLDTQNGKPLWEFLLFSLRQELLGTTPRHYEA